MVSGSLVHCNLSGRAWRSQHLLLLLVAGRPELCSSALLALPGSWCGVNAEGRRQEVEEEIQDSASHAPYEGGGPEEDVHCLLVLALYSLSYS